MVDLKPGDIFLTRNLKEEDNRSPGYWNHAAIYLGNGKFAEAQGVPFNQVIISDGEEFWDRYPHFLILRWKQDIGQQIVDEAQKFLGSPYRKFASIFLNLKPGENCVSLVRKTVKRVTGHDPRWRRPDHILSSDLLSVIYEKGEEHGRR